MTDYFIRHLTPRVTQIAKFEDSKEPEAIYKVTENTANNYYHCDCPGFRRNQAQDHKHILMTIMHDEYGFNYMDEELNGQVIFN